jgi:D-serine deaminase-like pyridoxal phosphate-dependent protein
MARRQVAHGAIGVTSATLTEAEAFVDGGVDDILVAHPPVGMPKLRRLEALAKRAQNLAVSLDDVGIAESLPPKVEVLWEVDTGGHRIGTLPGQKTVEAVRGLVRAIGEERFRGLITHAGHAYAARDLEGRKQAADEEAGGLASSTELLGKHGIEVRELSVGSTPTAGLSFEGVTEMRPGTYIYGDANQVALGSQSLEDCALAVVATVVSKHPDRIVVDAGSKALSADLRVGLLKGFGIVLGYQEVTVERLSEEHAVLTGPGISGIAIGDRLVIVPSHACTVANLHPAMLLVSSGKPARWLRCDAHGWRDA